MYTNNRPANNRIAKTFLPKKWGILSKVAKELGVSRSFVSDVARGKKTSSRVSAALQQVLNPPTQN